jgi:hypothetical protein
MRQKLKQVSLKSSQNTRLLLIVVARDRGKGDKGEEIRTKPGILLLVVCWSSLATASEKARSLMDLENVKVRIDAGDAQIILSDV